MDERHAAWLAALIDGEGSIIIRRSGGRESGCRIVIAQNDRRLLDRAAEYAECGRVYGGIGPGKKGHQLQITRHEDVRRVLLAVLPWLVLKDEKAALGLALLGEIERRRGGLGLPPRRDQFGRWVSEWQPGDSNPLVLGV